MGIYCAHCNQTIGGGLETLKKHLSKRHDPPYLCCEADCHRRKFTCRTSLYRHLREHHGEVCNSPSSSSVSSAQSDCSSSDETELETIQENGDILDFHHDHGINNSENSTTSGDDGSSSNSSRDSNDSDRSGEEDVVPFRVALERSAAICILDLCRKGNITGTAISIVMEETQKFLDSVVLATKNDIAINLKNGGVDSNIIDQCMNNTEVYEPFKSLKTKEQQITYFKDNFGYVAPREIPLGYREDVRIVNGVPVPRQVKKSFQYVSPTETIKAVLNNKHLFKLIHSEQKSTDGKLRSFLDGSLANNHPLISKYRHTIRLTLHTDDVDCVNPLGSKTGIHKMTELQFQIQNLPPEENARLRSVFILAYAYKEDLPEGVGIDAMLEPFFLEMQELESPDGVEIEVNGRAYTLRVTLVGMAADALAAHEVLGLYSPSCSRFCSLCTVSRKDFHQNIFAQGEIRTKELYQFHLGEMAHKSTKFIRQTYGVMKRSALIENSLHAHFPQACMKDAMHDILKGIAPMEIKLALHEFCFVKKYFDVFDFNAKIQSFDIGPADLKNKPSPNFSVDSVKDKGCYTIHQTAAQTWCLLQIFPFLVADKVPPDNPHLRLVVLLKRLSTITFSHVVSNEDLDLLDSIVEDHNRLFFQLYPPDNVAAHEENEPEENADDIEDEDYEDLPDDPDDWENYVLADSEEDEESESNADCTNREGPSVSRSPTENGRKGKAPKKIRPINKHHHLSHYRTQIEESGPAVLYWCMRFEGKHSLPKRYGAIICCYKNMPKSLIDLQQTNQCAELLMLDVEVKNEVFFSQGTLVAVKDTPHSEVLSVYGMVDEDVVEEIPQVTVSGFVFKKGLYLNLLLNDDAPIFGHIIHIYVHNEEVFIVTADCKGLYDNNFGAYRLESEEDPTVRVTQIANLAPDRPMTAWTVDYKTFYLSPRRTIAEALIVPDNLNI